MPMTATEQRAAARCLADDLDRLEDAAVTAALEQLANERLDEVARLIVAERLERHGSAAQPRS